MLLLKSKLVENNFWHNVPRALKLVANYSTIVESEQFRVLELYPQKKAAKQEQKKKRKIDVPPPRTTQMPVDQDWASVWPDTHAKDKLLRLLGNKYNPETDIITITADRCPTRRQNLDYVHYLLIAVYHESWRVEPWEAEKSLVDMEYFDWDTSQSRKNLVTLYKWPESPTDHDYDDIPNVTEFKIAVSDLINNGEDQYAINKYKGAVKTLLNLKIFFLCFL
ncbi:28S ribosomal protein S35, mitochondrial isoform X6 [Pseudomyrmex gracilis]|uniref:28S ribosomal protein S35, mitochondrial isoform X6 n=1 Tax=Pseudomyrmex gracilis TaxID=219809 RepID=UPI0009958F3E|nr:28S ribosomal protein S35, mitochondrial isoform X6 [Pseudomyrmex gracilis]